jgi:hypothetical protein
MPKVVSEPNINIHKKLCLINLIFSGHEIYGIIIKGISSFAQKATG